jgi:hypothetical protein
MQVEKFEITTDYEKTYGFMVYNRSGYSLPKGMISSMKVEQLSDGTNQVEYHIQSPSGYSPDSSDHLTYIMPAINSFELGKQVVDMYGEMVNAYIWERDQVA